MINEALKQALRQAREALESAPWYTRPFTPDDGGRSVMSVVLGLPAIGDILDCGHVNPGRDEHNIGTGYARTPAGFTMCYPCADEHERSAMANANEHVAYLSGDGKHITTWTGGELAKVTRHTKDQQGWGGTYIHFIRAVAPDGSEWYGRNGGPGMSIKIKRAKGKR